MSIIDKNDRYNRAGAEWHILARMFHSSGWVRVNFAENANLRSFSDFALFSFNLACCSQFYKLNDDKRAT